MVARRKDFGAPVESFFARQPPQLRAIVERLHALILEVAPAATSGLKWGMPSYATDGKPFVQVAAFKAHSNLILWARRERLTDPEGRLEGKGKGGAHAKFRDVAEIPVDLVRTWLREAVAYAKERAGAA